MKKINRVHTNPDLLPDWEVRLDSNLTSQVWFFEICGKGSIRNYITQILAFLHTPLSQGSISWTVLRPMPISKVGRKVRTVRCMAQTSLWNRPPVVLERMPCLLSVGQVLVQALFCHASIPCILVPKIINPLPLLAWHNLWMFPNQKSCHTRKITFKWFLIKLACSFEFENLHGYQR